MQSSLKWLKSVFKPKFLLPFLLWPLGLSAQQAERLTLDQAQKEAEQNYPLTKQRDLIKQTNNLSLENLSRGYLPQLSINGQATYQSAVTAIAIPIQGIEITPLSKDQYKVTADLSQVIYDGGTIKQQKQTQDVNSKIESQRNEVNIYQLRDRINQVFLGVLLQDAQMKQAELKQQDLEIGLKTVKAQVENGVIFKSNLYALEAEYLRTKQRTIELEATRKSLVQVMSLFLNRTLPDSTVFEVPAGAEGLRFGAPINRPELTLYNYQSAFFLQQFNLIKTQNRPRLSFFFQGGYGRPGLNFLLNDFVWYYIGGLRLSWNLSGFYTVGNNRKIMELNRSIVETNRSTFLLNTNSSLTQQQNEVEKNQALLQGDKEIIELRHKVTNASKAQLANGVLTTNDYLIQVNDENEARLILILHQLQLLQAEINYKTTAGEQ